MLSPKPVKKKIADKIIDAIAIGFIVPAVLTSPFGLYVIVSGVSRYYFTKRDFKREIKRLEKRGFVALTKTEKGWAIKLLEKGRKKQKDIKFNNLTLEREKSWDGKWRLFTFDIPEEYKIARKLINKKLKELGFYNIQRSVYVYPYNCKGELEILTEHYQVTKFTTYAEISYIDINKELKKYFKL